MRHGLLAATGTIAALLAIGFVVLGDGSPSSRDGRAQSGQEADTIPKRTVPADQKGCSQQFAVLTVEVRTHAGEPVLDAEIEVHRAADGELVRTVSEPGPGGGYFVLDDNLPGPVTPGVAFDVTARSGARSVTERLVAGVGPDGCHVALLSGSRVLVLPAEHTPG